MVAATSEHYQPVGDEDSSKRRQILDGARKVFMDLGFDGASMDEIARSAGVSKGTLYVYFADKSRLFEAIVEDEALEQGKVAFNFDPARDVETTLRDFGRAYIQLLCRPGGGSSIRTVMAIAERMPEVGRRFYENVLAKTINRLADYLQAHVRPAILRSRTASLRRRNSCRCARRRCFCRSFFRRLPRLAERIAASGRQRDADVSGGVSGEACVRAPPIRAMLARRIFRGTEPAQDRFPSGEMEHARAAADPDGEFNPDSLGPSRTHRRSRRPRGREPLPARSGGTRWFEKASGDGCGCRTTRSTPTENSQPSAAVWSWCHRDGRQPYQKGDARSQQDNMHQPARGSSLDQDT